MRTGVQFTGSLPPNASAQWLTYNWDPAWHVTWYVMPTSAQGTAELDWSIAVERSSATSAAYWITVNNRTAQNVKFEARYAVLAP
jgi:hypothetical protein